VFGVHGAVFEATDVRVTVLNISAAGMLVHSPVLLRAGERHEFSFELNDALQPARVSARVVHLTALDWFHGEAYFIGLAFPEHTQEHRATVDRLIAACRNRDD
jgi:hypothetical protein